MQCLLSLHVGFTLCCPCSHYHGLCTTRQPSKPQSATRPWIQTSALASGRQIFLLTDQMKDSSCLMLMLFLSNVQALPIYCCLCCLSMFSEMLVRAGTSIPILDTSHHPALRVAAATPRAAMRQSAILALSVCCSQDFTGVKVGLEELDIATIAIKRLVQRFVVEWIRQTIVWIVK